MDERESAHQPIYREPFGRNAKPGLASRIFTAISRERVNVIAIAQGSNELTIAVVVNRDGLEKAVQAVHAECGMGAGRRKDSDA